MSGVLAGAAAGIFGKLPAHGDFVRRNLPTSFVEPWDSWLSAGMVAAMEGAGEEGWPAAWEAATPFRFRLAPRACGPDAVLGVTLPSTDMVGRRFPLTLAAVLPDGGEGEDWFDAAEAAGQRAAAGGLDADAVAALIPLPTPGDPDATMDGACRFWRGGEAVLVSSGLPPPERLAELLRIRSGGMEAP